MKDQVRDFDRLFAQHSDNLFRFCNRILGDKTEAEDVAQDAFVTAFKQWGTFRGEATEKTWLYSIAYHLARRARSRKRLRALWRPGIPEQGDQSFTLVVEEAIEKLPANLRDAFVLVKLEGFTCEEAGMVTGVPAGTIKFRIHSAVGKLRSALSTTVFESHDEEVNHVV